MRRDQSDDGSEPSSRQKEGDVDADSSNQNDGTNNGSNPSENTSFDGSHVEIDIQKELQGGLQAHEAVPGTPGGHTIEKHVGKPDKDLIERLDREPDRPAVSTFTDLATAEEAIAKAIVANKEEIARFLEGADKVLAFDFETGIVVGRLLKRGIDGAVEATKLRLVLIQDPKMPLGYRILTGYPTK